MSHDSNISRYMQRVIAIRDGKTASETVHKKRNNGPDEAVPAEEAEEHFEELVVLDSAGRLQVPKPYREALGISHRVRMEMTAEGLLIRPLAEDEVPPAAVSPNAGVPSAPERSRWRRWLGRLKKIS